jgi:hypothetical protein
MIMNRRRSTEEFLRDQLAYEEQKRIKIAELKDFLADNF